MNHCCEHECKHAEVKFCQNCKAVYCANCKHKWVEPCQLSHYSWTYTYPSVGYAVGGAAGSPDYTVTTTAECNLH